MFLQLRLYALYFRDKRILACISIVSILAAVGSSYVMGNALSHITGVYHTRALCKVANERRGSSLRH